MVIKYSNIKTLKKLFTKMSIYNYWFNFILSITNFGKKLFSKTNIINFDIRFFRFFFWLFLFNNNYNTNFLSFYKKLKYWILYFKLLVYLKNNNIIFYNILNFNKILFIKKINYLLLNKNISIIFVYDNSNIASKFDNKLIYINYINYNQIKFINYLLLNN